MSQHSDALSQHADHVRRTLSFVCASAIVSDPLGKHQGNIILPVPHALMGHWGGFNKAPISKSWVGDSPADVARAGAVSAAAAAAAAVLNIFVDAGEGTQRAGHGGDCAL